MRWVLIGIGSALMLAGSMLGYMQVAALESREVDVREGDLELRLDAPSRDLVQVQLGAGDSVVVELCTSDDLASGVWTSNAQFEVWFVEARARVGLRSMSEAVDNARSLRGRACMTIAHATDIPAGGEFLVRFAVNRVEAGAPAAPSAVSVRARAYPTENSTSSTWFWALFMGVSLLIGASLLPHRRGGEAAGDPAAATMGGGLEAVDAFLEGEPELRAPEPSPAPPSRELWRVIAGMGLFYAAIHIVGGGMFTGRGGAVLGGLSLAALEIVISFGLSWGAMGVLGLHLGDGKKRWWILLAPVAGLLVRAAGGWIRTWVPTSGDAPIELLISWPSGALAVGVVAAVAPIVEELFFRGFVYGWVERRLGPRWAFVLSAVLFTLAHASQTWGAWGAFASVALVGFTASGLRWVSGSTLVPMVAHFAYNASIVARIL